MSLQHVITTRRAYDKALTDMPKPELRKEITEYLRRSIPAGMTLEWDQGEGDVAHAVCSPVIFPDKIQISRHDGLPVKGRSTDDPDTEWSQGDPFDGYRLDDGVGKYKSSVPGLTRADLKKLIDAWTALPDDVLLRVFGSATVRVKPSGKLTVVR